MALDVFSSVRGLLKPEEIIIDNFVFQVMRNLGVLSEMREL